MTVYESNLQFLKERAYDLYKVATDEKSIYEVNIKEVEGHDNCLIKYGNSQCFVHSLYSIDEEMTLMFSSVPEDSENLVILGIGTGKILEYVKKNYRFIKKLIIIEPSLQIFKRFLSRYSFKNVFKEMGLVSMLVNKSEADVSKFLFSALYEETEKPYDMVAVASYISLFSDYYNSIKKQIVSSIRTSMAHMVTLHWTKYKWINNTFNNMRHDSISHTDIMGILKGKPAVIVSAGPSLNKHIHVLNDLKRKAIVVAVGSAMKILDSNGIKPQMRAAIDGSFNASIYDDEFFELSEQIPILFASQLTDQLLPLYNGKKIHMTLETDYINSYLNNKMDMANNPVISGASVANAATWFLSQAGCNPIIFIGQDMCIYDDGLYAKGRSQYDRKNFSNLNVIEMIDVYGKKVVAPRGYLQIKYDFENKIKNFPNTRYINATEGGLGIDGTEIKSLVQVIEEDLPEMIDLDLNYQIDMLGIQENNTLDNKKIYLIEMKDEIESVLEISEKIINKLKKITIKRENGIKVKKILSLLEEIDKKDIAKLKGVNFYENVVIHQMVPTIQALKKKYSERGKDEDGRALAWEKYLYNITMEIIVFLVVIRDKINEILSIEYQKVEETQS